MGNLYGIYHFAKVCETQHQAIIISVLSSHD